MRLPCLLVLACLATAAHSHEVSTNDWIRLGERVHGGYGSLIALGVRIGLDARERVSAAARDLDVTYSDGENTPCACVVDGILMATAASPGQGTLRGIEEVAVAVVQRLGWLSTLVADRCWSANEE